MWTQAKPLLSLMEWASAIGLNPYIVAQIAEPDTLLFRERGRCENPFYQRADQGFEALSREDVANAIIEAEHLIAEMALTFPAPKYDAQTVAYPREARLDYTQLWMGSTGRLKPVYYKYGNIISMGTYEETLIEADVAITPDDPYGDGFDTAFSATVTVPLGTTADELTFYFSAGDIPDEFSRADMDIRPLKVVISGTTATIQGKMVQVVLVSNYLKQIPEILDATDAAIYADTIDVYRRTVDLTQSGSIQWDNTDFCPEPPCTYTAASACFYATNAREGIVTPIPGQFDSDLQEYERVFPDRWRAPDRVNMNVISGIPRLPNGQMAEPWRKWVAQLATALMPQSKACGCAMADTILYFYRSLPLRDDGTLEVSQNLVDAVGNKWGNTFRGAVRTYAALASNETDRIYRGTNS